MIQPQNLFIINNEYKYFTNNVLYENSKNIIYMGNLLKNPEKNFNIAIKTENMHSKTSKIKSEYEIYNYLNDNNLNIGIPKFYNFTSIEICKETFKNYLIIQLLGHNLKQLFELSFYNFIPLATFNIILKIIDIIKNLHDNKLIYRNIHPSHFLYERKITTDLIPTILDKHKTLNIETSNELYCIDYSLAKFYIDKNTNEHIEFKDNENEIGNVDFASVWSLLGNRQSRRDDLESIFYLLIYFLRGKLPWEDIKGKNKNDLNKKKKLSKISLSIFEICKNVALLFQDDCMQLLNYIRNLEFDEEPKYDYIKNVINEMKKKFIFYNNNNKNLVGYIIINDFTNKNLRRNIKDDDEKVKLKKNKNGYVFIH
jgi:serine/threonine protein kinase